MTADCIKRFAACHIHGCAADRLPKGGLLRGVSDRERDGTRADGFSGGLCFGEELSALGVIGICAVLAGIVFLAMPNRDKTIKGGLGSGVFWGLLTGFFIASYSSLDGFAIQLLGMAPLIHYEPGMFVRLLFLGPPVLLRPFARAAFKEDLQKRWKYALFIGAAHPAAYLLVLFALLYAPLAYVAPTREISMLLALFIGAAALKEKVTSHKIFGVVCMLAGVILLALAK